MNIRTCLRIASVLALVQRAYGADFIFDLLWPPSGSNTLSSVNGVVLGSDGVLYGTEADNASPGSGSVFRIATDGSAFATLHQFTNSPGNGVDPRAALIQGADGALYGTTYGAWSTNSEGAGSIFKINTNGLFS